MVLVHPQNNRMGRLCYPYYLRGDKWKSQGSINSLIQVTRSVLRGICPRWVPCACFMSPVGPWPSSDEMMNMWGCVLTRRALYNGYVWWIIKGEGGRNGRSEIEPTCFHPFWRDAFIGYFYRLLGEGVLTFTDDFSREIKSLGYVQRIQELFAWCFQKPQKKKKMSPPHLNP